MRDFETKNQAKKAANDNQNQKKENYKEQKVNKPLQNKLKKIEQDIQKLEGFIQKDDLQLASNYETLANDVSFFKAYEQKKLDLKALLEEWEMVFLEMESE